MQARHWLLWLFALIASGACFGLDLPLLRVGGEGTDLRPSLVYWQQPADAPSRMPHKGQPLDVASFAPWQPLRADHPPNFGLEPTVWFALRVRNDSGQTGAWLLDYDHPDMAEFDVYLLRQGRVVEAWHGGSRRASAIRPIMEPHFLYPLPLAAGEELEVLMRTHIHSALLPQYLQVVDAFGRVGAKRGVLAIQTGSLGVMLALVLYGLVLYMNARQPAYLWLLAYLGSLALFEASVALHGSFLWASASAETKAITNRGTFLLLTLSLPLLFVAFLDVRRRLPWLAWTIYIFTILQLTIRGVALLRDPLGPHPTPLLFWAHLFVFMAGVGLMLWRYPSPRLKLFCLAAVPLVLLLAYLTLVSRNVLPYLNGVVEVALSVNAFMMLYMGNYFLAELRENAQAAQADREAQGRFLARMSHEIRTPMNAILGMAQLLEDAALSPRHRSYLNTIMSAGQTLMTVLNDILDYSKIEAGEMRLEHGDVDLHLLAEESLAIFRGQAQQKGICLLGEIAPDCPRWVAGDITRLRQILLNLLSNAVKFTDRGEVVLSVSLAPGGGVRLAVSDSGEGLSQEQQARLFQRFSQASTDVARRRGGTGLGLAICKQLVDLMGGDIGVDSEPGQGACFWCVLPLAAVPDPTPVDEHKAHEPLQGRRLLLVDGSARYRQSALRVCEGWGLRVQQTCNSAEALQWVREAHELGQPFDLIVLDEQLPDVAGLVLAKRLHDAGACDGAKVVLLHGLNQLPEAARVEQAGIALVEEKPTLPLRLASILLQAMGCVEERPELRVKRSVAERQLRVLVAEDNATNRLVAAGMLRKLGHAVELVENGRQAMQACTVEGRPYDAVLMDCEMPEMNGWQSTEAIRAWEREHGAGRLPIVALSAHAMEAERERCLASGMDEFLGKPLLLDVLQRILLSVTERQLERVG